MMSPAALATPVTALLARLGEGNGAAGPFPRGPSRPIPPGSVWGLTGATGWWGRHLARSLLSCDPKATLVVPVRASSRTAAVARLHSAWVPTAALRRQAQEERWWSRTHALALDSIALPPGSGGLRPWHGLDVVVHAAASTSLALSLGQAWEANVSAVQRAWDWACAGGARRFDHVSTLSVWLAGQTPPGVVLEKDRLDAAISLWGGYAASKWAAEAWLATRGPGGVVPSVHRLGLASHSPVEGWNRCDPLAATAMAWARWGRPSWLAPAPADKVDWSPVQRTVDGVLAVARGGATGPFHWASRESVPAQAWLDALSRRLGDTPGEWPAGDALGKAARRAFGRWSNPSRARRLWWHDVFQSGRHRFGADNTLGYFPRWTWSPQDLDAALASLPSP